MIILTENDVAGLVEPDDCLRAVEDAFASMAKGTGTNFPVIREELRHADAIYGFKSGFDRASLALGLKSGGFWPGNVANCLTNHQSTIFLFDADSGRCKAVVGGNLITALRTAAASAVSIKHLANPQARVLGIVGAGHQASFQVEAALRQRQFDRVIAWNRDPAKLQGLAAIAERHGSSFESVDLERLASEAEVIVTITSSRHPLLPTEAIKPGTHLACMGTDTKGKQEVSTAIFGKAKVFTDEPMQAITIGEAQHAFQEGILSRTDLIAIGDVISGSVPGRTAEAEVTIFDGTGVALQDLAVAGAVVERAIARGAGIKLEV